MHIFIYTYIYIYIYQVNKATTCAEKRRVPGARPTCPALGVPSVPVEGVGCGVWRIPSLRGEGIHRGRAGINPGLSIQESTMSFQQVHRVSWSMAPVGFPLLHIVDIRGRNVQLKPHRRIQPKRNSVSQDPNPQKRQLITWDTISFRV